VDAAEVVVGREQSDHGFVVVPELAETVRQPGESPDAHAKRQVRLLDMVRAGAVEIRVARDRSHVDVGYPEGVARRSAWHFLNRVDDSRVSSLRRVAKAIGASVKDLF